MQDTNNRRSETVRKLAGGFQEFAEANVLPDVPLKSQLPFCIYETQVLQSMTKVDFTQLSKVRFWQHQA